MQNLKPLFTKNRYLHIPTRHNAPEGRGRKSSLEVEGGGVQKEKVWRREREGEGERGREKERERERERERGPIAFNWRFLEFPTTETAATGYPNNNKKKTTINSGLIGTPGRNPWEYSGLRVPQTAINPSSCCSNTLDPLSHPSSPFKSDKKRPFFKKKLAKKNFSSKTPTESTELPVLSKVLETIIGVST